jgi:hypothetical protein
MIAGAGARDVKQMALGVMDLFEIGIVRDILDALLRWEKRPGVFPAFLIYLRVSVSRLTIRKSGFSGHSGSRW